MQNFVLKLKKSYYESDSAFADKILVSKVEKRMFIYVKENKDHVKTVGQDSSDKMNK